MDILKYKDYEGTASVDMERQVCHGKLLFIDDLVTYESDSPATLMIAFREAVNDYLDTCRQIGKEPLKTIRGAFNVRVPAEMHRDAIRYAIKADTSLNDVVVRALDLLLHGKATFQSVTNHFTLASAPNRQTSRAGSSAGPAHWEENWLSAVAGVDQ